MLVATEEQTSTWEELCERARLAVEQADEGRWQLGDIGVTCERQHGEHSLAELAKECNTGRSSMYAYTRTAGMFAPDDRNQYPNLGYGHYQAASQLSDYHEALDFLREASDEGYTVDQARREARKRKGVTPRDVLLDMEGTIDELIARLMGLSKDLIIKAKITSAV